MSAPDTYTKDDARHAWSRHYDTIQWTANTFLLTAAGALHIYVHEHESASFALVGAGLMLVSVFFTKSFRNLRNQVHRTFTEDEWRQVAPLITNSSIFYQGTVNTIIQTLFFLTFMLQVHNFRQGHGSLCLIGAISGVGVIYTLELLEKNGRRALPPCTK